MSVNYQLIDLIRQTINKSAEEAKYGAAMGGFHHDGGAYAMRKDFDTWLDGVNFAITSETKSYGEIIEEHRRKSDPDYQQYLEMKKKFEDEWSNRRSCIANSIW